jgi:hypothetical protein
MNTSFDFHFGFSKISIYKTSNLAMTYGKGSSSYSSNHQDEVDNNLDIPNGSFMDQLLFRSARLLHASANLHLLNCPCPLSIEVTWFLMMNINTSSAMHALW